MKQHEQGDSRVAVKSVTAADVVVRDLPVMTKLVRRGRHNAGWLSYDDVNDALPASIHTVDHIEDVLELLTDAGITIGDSRDEAMRMSDPDVDQPPRAIGAPSRKRSPSPSPSPSPTSPRTDYFFEAGRAAPDGERTFRPKKSGTYSVVFQGGIQKKKRSHETTVVDVAAWFKSRGALVSNPHPFDLLVSTATTALILEIKTVQSDPIFAVREAVGQLLEYRHFSRIDAQLCIVLDAQPSEQIIAYVEESLGMMLLWHVNKTFSHGPATEECLRAMGVLERRS